VESPERRVAPAALGTADATEESQRRSTRSATASRPGGFPDRKRGRSRVISIAVVTHDRLELLGRCVDNVLSRTSHLTREIIIWDNASTDGTTEYLDGLADERVEVVHHPENIAMNARARALALAKNEYLIEMDDDVVDAPMNWDETLLDAYLKLEDFGRLAPFLEYDPEDSASLYLRYMREERGAYPLRIINGTRIFEGTPGGACTMIAREIYDRVGGYDEHRRYPYWRPEVPFERRMQKLGFRSGFLADLEIRHAGGHTAASKPKIDYYFYALKRRQRRNQLKRMLLALPLVPALNDHFRWFEPPVSEYDPETYRPEERERR
jgi:GT2 family glycosyltransferase